MKIKFLFLIQLLLLSTYSFSQKINLSKNEGEIYEATVASNKEFKITLINKLIDEDYKVSVTRKFIPIDLFSVPGQTNLFAIVANIAGASECDQLKTEAQELYNIKDEKILSEKVKALEKKIRKIKAQINNGDVVDEACLKLAISGSDFVIDQTKETIWSDRLKPGEQLEIVITRVEAGETKKWTHIYSTEPRGEWQVSYGFSFITQGFNKEDIFFASPSTAVMSNDFIVTKEINRRSMSFAPSIFFTWMPTKRLNKGLSFGVSGGLGFDFENPTVFLSPTFSINQNIKIHLGLVAHKQNVLLGKYTENQTISEDLTDQQLHEELYKINPFFSISFRFSENPFSQGN